ncbi:tRNA preQ1(34) S-adenosylmethionine ribosyltransferase-isomerase QueA [Pelagibacterium flavum]|uniref:S-adenosylmethionine:tRNA ribosyltransferase-isomerase n=1 Tax=Pelagibacterium flavum TaxID=2984530 RepID=A0ABY6IIW3_9HYPH|nr:tRNA preQ1(34) S-adenosylmethionine ribosyltransferase-isomerase QueA [Pelagibacterium sp. YIM 151497]MAN76950.1 tRNA preQ1(34) S-adenosylmethionine ribosyltransferase-isomerase QueA [Hyphomicrobiales bacterium]UYQ70513.1 tRNA preQ1(34) S-adenosylmethionine ribosyltransferase-isomerase QueA [Pelagibacterium sp. YIM 151497]|tara:strand:- start:3061 stop:4134 length:1074 start_codon:yes stop_codon:yes gene_type:complete
MKVDLFDFDLPEDRIALHPVSPRDSAKMLVVAEDGGLTDHVVTDLETILRAGDVLVVNDTRVIPADLRGTRHRGEFAASVSFNLHKRVDGSTWLAFARPAKRLKIGDRVVFGATSEVCMLDELAATVKAVEDGQVTLGFDFSDAVLDEAIKARGAMPLPPYIGAKRDIEERDKTDYQTVYAEHDGAVAAPTAGLHFTPELLERLENKGVAIEHVTLHVGAGTFLPMKADDTEDHVMHAEWGVVAPETVERIHAAKAAGGRIVAVGTTSLRLLESAARKTGALEPFADETDIFITPGFGFRVVDVLMTNFHLPRSTLFMLVSAFSGLETMHKAYKHAIDHHYRFYSYGDSSLLFRANR